MKKNFRFKRFFATGAWLTALAVVLIGAACEPQTPQQTTQNTAATNLNANSAATTNTMPQTVASPEAAKTEALNLPVTLPVLDAMFADEKFGAELKSKLGLTDEQIGKLRETAREATANLNEAESENGSTNAATKNAAEQISQIIGADKAAQFNSLISERWAKGGDEADTSGKTVAASDKPNGVPTDTRIVVNAPAYRMDLFKDGKLVRSYKIGIGYPEFPLPMGIRKASTIIFNPTWTPPDEPWVKGKIKAGEKVAAGSALNPLGPIKIPIGSPSLIHGGKALGKLGGFASHGCVGLTNAQVQDVAFSFAAITGTPLTGEDMLNYAKNKTETKNVQLKDALPVELRYETIVVEDGKLKIYRDVYERGTNTEANLRKVLEANGVSLDSLSEPERAKVLDGLKQMALDAGGNEVETDTNAKKNSSQTVTRNIKGKKEVIIEVAALKGKGYPAPVDLNTGGKSKPLNLSAATADAKQTSGNANQNANANQVTGGKRF